MVLNGTPLMERRAAHRTAMRYPCEALPLPIFRAMANSSSVTRMFTVLCLTRFGFNFDAGFSTVGPLQ